jgi:hypothetical protein
MRAVEDNILMPWSSIEDPAQNNNTVAGLGAAPTNFINYVMELNLGLFKQPLYLAANACPLTLELMLQTDPNLPVIQQEDGNGALITNYSWMLSDVCVLCDVLQLSPDFSSNIDQLLLSGSSLQIPYKLMATQYTSFAPGSTTISCIAQFAFSRVCCVLAHFTANPPAGGFMNKLRPYLNNGNAITVPANCKNFNYFAGPYGPIAQATGDMFSASLHIGGLIIPSQPQTGVSTQFMYLQQCVNEQFGIQTMNIGSVSEFGSYSFVLGYNLERVPCDAYASGLSLKAGETVTLQCNNLPINAAEDGIGQFTGVYLTFVCDSILDISGSGITIAQ